METTIFLLFLCTAVEGEIGTHIFVPIRMPWLDAQTYCRKNYTDLSFADSQSDQDRLVAAAGVNITDGWIGLHRDPSNINSWKWSGGGYVTYNNWGGGQPDNANDNEPVGHIMSDGRWNDIRETKHKPFYCISIKAVEVRMTWEDALEHCRESHTYLTSLLSENECLLAQREIQKAHITKWVWIGLRYLEDRWFWVNNNPLVYQAWSKDGAQDRQCPKQRRCGALTKDGLWENLDCQDKLNFICH
ncbi:hypothetical protein ABVT39_021401 [Epinephelus coioides]